MALISITIDLNGRNEEIKLDLDDQVGCHRNILESARGGKLYEPDVSIALLKILEAGDTFIDIGANIGFFSIFASKLVGDEGKVVSFEANIENYEILLEHARINAADNIVSVCKPVADKSGTRLFYHNADDAGGHALWDPATLERNVKSAKILGAQERETIALNDFFSENKNLPKPKVIKIDIEGAEELALTGARELLDGAAVPYIICELHNFGLKQLGGSQNSLRQLMSGLGYEMFSLAMDGRLPKLIPNGVELRSEFIVNVLFSQPGLLARYWPHDTYIHDEWTK